MALALPSARKRKREVIIEDVPDNTDTYIPPSPPRALDPEELSSAYLPLAPWADKGYKAWLKDQKGRKAWSRMRRKRYGYGKRYYRRYRRSYGRRYRRRSYYGGRGAYYLKAGGNISGSLPFGKFGLHGEGGLASKSMIKGLGAYDQSAIVHNTLITPDIPEVRNSHYVEGATIIRHREYLGAITTSSVAGEFKVEEFPLNPAQSGTFPWLSTIAANYEEYRPNGLFFEFRSTASDAIASSTNLALGQVMMCTQYDPTDPGFNTDNEMLNYSWAQSGKVSESFRHFVECDPKQSPLAHLYTRTGGPSNDNDLRFSDFGTFSIATQGLQGTSVQIGQLWVSYEFLLYKPKIGEDQAQNGGWYKARNNTGVTTVKPLGTLANVLLDPENNLYPTLTDAGGLNQRINFERVNKPTSYLLNYFMEGTSDGANVDVPTYVVSSGVHVCSKFMMNTVVVADHPEGTFPNSSKTKGLQLIITITDTASSSEYVQLNGGASLPAGTVRMDLCIAQIPWMDPDLY